MSPEELKLRDFESEVVYSAVRSSGPGGQNVNKVNTKVELRFNITSSLLLDEGEKELLFRKLKNKINKEGELVLSSQASRTNLSNKEAVTEKFFTIVAAALTLPKKRRPTRPTLASKERRLTSKRKQANIKKLRSDTPGDNIE